jgi:hypothetical protein
MKKLLIILLLFVPAVAAARGGGGGGGRASFSGARSSFSSTSRTSTSSTSRTGTTSSTASRPSTSTKTTTSATAPKPGYSKTGSVVGSGGYAPRFRGYAAPAGSTVYYHSTSAWDWLPFFYIMHASDHQSATVVQPDGKKVEVKQDGVDGMLIFNWIMLILLTLGLIALIVWFVNKRTNKGTPSYATVW